MKIIVTYSIEAGNKKMTKQAEADIDDTAIVSPELAEALWRAVREKSGFVSTLSRDDE